MFNKDFAICMAVWVLFALFYLAAWEPTFGQWHQLSEPPYAFEINGKRGIPQAMLEQEPESIPEWMVCNPPPKWALAKKDAPDINDGIWQHAVCNFKTHQIIWCGPMLSDLDNVPEECK